MKRREVMQTAGAASLALPQVLADAGRARRAGRPHTDGSKVVAFHLDEYIGLSEHHPAPFRPYLRERFAQRLPQPIGPFHYIDAEENPRATK